MLGSGGEILEPEARVQQEQETRGRSQELEQGGRSQELEQGGRSQESVRRRQRVILNGQASK